MLALYVIRVVRLAKALCLAKFYKIYLFNGISTCSGKRIPAIIFCTLSRWFVASNSGKDAERTADKAGDNLSGAAKDAQRGAEKAGDKLSGAADDAKRDVKRNL